MIDGHRTSGQPEGNERFQKIHRHGAGRRAHARAYFGRALEAFPAGEGLPRLIASGKSKQKPRVLRIAVLRFEAEDTRSYYVADFFHQLREAGHHVAYADKTLRGLNMDVKRVAKLVSKTKADAWIVISGSNQILRWFAAQPLPCFGLFGQISDLPIAGAGTNQLRRGAICHGGDDYLSRGRLHGKESAARE